VQLPAVTTVAGLHAVVQAAFGWTGTHLHRFVVQGREYGIGYVGGVGADPHLVRLADLGLRPTERFAYDYDFTDGWRLGLRLEQILVMDPGRVYPRCTGGRRAAPPEAGGGVWVFLEQTQPHHVLAATLRAVEILSLLLEAEDLTRFGEHRDELAAMVSVGCPSASFAAGVGPLFRGWWAPRRGLCPARSQPGNRRVCASKRDHPYRHPSRAPYVTKQKM